MRHDGTRPGTERGRRRRAVRVVESIDSGFRGRRVYTFDGGCTSIELEFDVDVSAALVSEVSIALGFVTRDEVNERGSLT